MPILLDFLLDYIAVWPLTSSSSVEWDLKKNFLVINFFFFQNTRDVFLKLHCRVYVRFLLVLALCAKYDNHGPQRSTSTTSSCAFTFQRDEGSEQWQYKYNNKRKNLKFAKKICYLKKILTFRRDEGSEQWQYKYNNRRKNLKFAKNICDF